MELSDNFRVHNEIRHMNANPNTSARITPADLDFMIALETWATTDNAIIRAIAIIMFDPRGEGIGERRLIDARASTDDQIEKLRTVDQKTPAWWRGQQPLAVALRNKGALTTGQLRETIGLITEFIAPLIDHETGRIRGNIWSRGNFDCRILRHAWPTFSADGPPWAYWQEMDVRTLDTMVEHVRPACPHDPLSDCMAQIRQVQNACAMAASATSPTISEICP